MLRIFISIISVLLCGICSGQNLDNFKGRIARPDSLGGGRIQVVEYGSAAAAVDRLSHTIADPVRVYRVCLFVDNTQNSDQRAAEINVRFKDLYPRTPTFVKYEAPYWSVLVGNCISEEEAIILKGRVEGSFPKAFVTQEKERVSVSKLSE